MSSESYFEISPASSFLSASVWPLLPLSLWELRSGQGSTLCTGPGCCPCMSSASFSWLLTNRALLFFFCFLLEGPEGEVSDICLDKQTLKGSESRCWEWGPRLQDRGLRLWTPALVCVLWELVWPCCGALGTIASRIPEQRQKTGDQALGIFGRDPLSPSIFFSSRAVSLRSHEC